MDNQPSKLLEGTSDVENESTRSQHETPESCVTDDCFAGAVKNGNIMCSPFCICCDITTELIKMRRYWLVGFLLLMQSTSPLQ